VPRVLPPEPPEENLYQGKVIEIFGEGTTHINGIENRFQDVRVELLSGPQKGSTVDIKHGSFSTLTQSSTVEKDDHVVILEFERPDGSMEYSITDKYRLNTLLMFAGLFVLAVMSIARWKGVGSLIGLGVSFLVIIYFIIPQILAGKNPLLISIVGASIIMITTLYLAHGFYKKTTIALISTMITFVFIGILSVIAVHISRLSGLGSEEAYSLQYGLMNQVNFQGLFLGGILIGALGVLDDVTTSLTTAIFEIAKNHKNASFGGLFKSGMEIGREHIASLVNTLVLAYAGASLPIFLFIVINPSGNPLWSILNNELVAEEIIRVLVGSFGLVLAVPLTALLASYGAFRDLKN